MYKKFNDITQTYTLSQQYDVQPLCNSILITNIGGDPLEVNQKLLLPGVAGQLSITSNVLGDSCALGGNEGEVYNRRTIQIKFAGTGANPLVEVTQKFYEP